MYRYTMEYYSNLKKKIACHLQQHGEPGGIMESELSQSEKDKYTWHRLYVESLKKKLNS